MTPILPIRIIPRNRPRRLLALIVTASFVAGLFTALSLTASYALAPLAVSSALIEVGEHLCKSHEGLANLTRLSEDRYAFECRELAQFPDVQVTLKEVGK